MKAQHKLALISVLAISAAMAIARCGVTPIFLHSDSNLVIAGDSVTYTVGVSDVAPTGGQVVTITPDDPDHFSSIPSTVTVLAGHTSADFEATTDSETDGAVTVTVSCNGGSKDCQILVQSQK